MPGWIGSARSGAEPAPLRKRMQLRSWIILAALALARVAFGYQFQTVATLGTELVQRFGLSLRPARQPD